MEIQKAEEFAHYSHDLDTWEATIKAIHARDKAIIERCMEAITERYDGKGTLRMFRAMLKSLGDVLREIS